MNIHSVSLKGRRESNEDKHSVIFNEDGHETTMATVNYLGVYDGHGGKYVSRFLSQSLPPLFLGKQVTYPLTRNYILDTYKSLQDQLKESHKEQAMRCGSTCLVVVHYKAPSDGRYYINLMNTGDCRCVICRDNLGIPLSKDHKPNWPEERARIQALGGNIYFDGDDYRIKELSVSRAFGDLEAEPFVTYVPDIYRYRLERSDKFLIIACDGLWDKLSNQEVVNFVLTECYDNTTNVRINREINIAKKLGEYAIQKGSTDNVTIIVCFLSG